MKWVFICGAHSVGKTTLWNYLGKHLLIENQSPALLSEVAREILTADKIVDGFEDDDAMFQSLNYNILKAQHAKLEKARHSKATDTLFISDRGPLDPICYLQMFAKNDGIKNAMELEHVNTMIKMLQDANKALVFVIKPHKPFLEYDRVRINSTFEELLEYDQIMRQLMTDLNISFVYIEKTDLHLRAKLVAENMKSRWPKLAVKCFDQIL